MEDEILKHLYDIREAVSAIRGFVAGKAFEDYRRDELLRSGVERKFEIIGEALNRREVVARKPIAPPLFRPAIYQVA